MYGKYLGKIVTDLSDLPYQLASSSCTLNRQNPMTIPLEE